MRTQFRLSCSGIVLLLSFFAHWSQGAAVRNVSVSDLCSLETSVRKAAIRDLLVELEAEPKGWEALSLRPSEVRAILAEAKEVYDQHGLGESPKKLEGVESSDRAKARTALRELTRDILCRVSQQRAVAFALDKAMVLEARSRSAGRKVKSDEEAEELEEEDEGEDEEKGAKKQKGNKGGRKKQVEKKQKGKKGNVNKRAGRGSKGKSQGKKGNNEKRGGKKQESEDEESDEERRGKKAGGKSSRGSARGLTAGNNHIAAALVKSEATTSQMLLAIIARGDASPKLVSGRETRDDFINLAASIIAERAKLQERKGGEADSIAELPVPSGRNAALAEEVRSLAATLYEGKAGKGKRGGKGRSEEESKKNGKEKPKADDDEKDEGEEKDESVEEVEHEDAQEEERVEKPRKPRAEPRGKAREKKTKRGR